MKELGRLLTAMVTPFNEEGAVAYEQSKRLALALLESGSDGVVVVGTTGESHTLIREEELRLFSEVKSVVGERGTVLAGTGSNSTAEALGTTKEAERVGVDACLLVVPYYNKPTQEGLYQHYKKVAETVNIPIVVYNIPGRTAVNIEPSTFARLAEIDNIVGVKEASGSMKQITEIIRLCGDKLTVVSGEDYLTYPLMCVGGKGVICVVANIVPRDMADLCNLLLAGDFERGRELYYRLLPLCHAMFYETNPAPIKAALEMFGKISSGEVRLPLAPMSDANREKLRKDLQAYGVL